MRCISIQEGEGAWVRTYLLLPRARIGWRAVNADRDVFEVFFCEDGEVDGDASENEVSRRNSEASAGKRSISRVDGRRWWMLDMVGRKCLMED